VSQALREESRHAVSTIVYDGPASLPQRRGHQVHNTCDLPAAVRPEPFEEGRLKGEKLAIQLPSQSVVVLELAS
jgi:hypothetical protein